MPNPSTSDRVTTRTVTFPNGMRARTFQAPADFDLATATDAELVRIGLPTRPEDPGLAEHYDQIRARMAGKFHYIPATLQLDETISHQSRQRNAAATEQTNNWSGGVVYAPANKTFKSVLGQWIVPDVDAPTENTWYYAGSWVGLDGDGSDDVCQSGVECSVTRTGTAITRDIWAWYQWYHAAYVKFTNFPISPGDLVHVVVCANAGDSKATVLFNNLTTGASTGANFDAQPGATLVGNCAEWIVEAPNLQGTQNGPLADYGQVFFSGSASLNDNTVVGVSGGDNINMTDANGNNISTGTLVTDSVVQCQYVGTKP